jgi:glutamate dehydrogenase
VRINGAELRCRVVGEGGNLGFTQRGPHRVRAQRRPAQHRLHRQLGGVDCSDHEVNIKILIKRGQPAPRADAGAAREAAGRHDRRGRHAGARNNYLQTQAISIAEVHGPERVTEHGWFIRQLEKRAGLNRALEFLPDEEEIELRRKAGKGLTRPELALVMSYAKMALYGEMVSSNVPEDPYLGRSWSATSPSRCGGATRITCASTRWRARSSPP